MDVRGEPVSCRCFGSVAVEDAEFAEDAKGRPGLETIQLES